MKNTRNEVRLTVPQLRQIIHNAIESYLNSDNNCEDNPKIDDGVPIFEHQIGGYGDSNFIKNKPTEGLIQTSPLEKVKDILIRKYSLHPSQVHTEDITDDGNVVTFITIVLPSKMSKSIIGDIKHTMEVCDYFAIGNFELFPSDKRYGGLTFEPKFSKT